MANVNVSGTQAARESGIVEDVRRTFGELTTWRNVFAMQWEEVAQLVLPTYRNTFFYGSINWPGMKKTQQQVDATAMLALGRFSAIMDSLLTPRNMTWHTLEPDQEELRKDHEVQMYFEQATRALFKARYRPEANFASQNLQTYSMLGAFGTGGTFIDRLAGETAGLRYKSIPLGELFLRENHQGQVDTFIRWFRMTARQAYKQWGDNIPATLKAAMDQKSEAPFQFLHLVAPNNEYEEGRLDDKGKQYKSCYVSIEGNWLLQEGGYNSFPLPVARYNQGPLEVYGRGPAMDVLPAIKTLNAEKSDFLRQGHQAVNPALLMFDDGLMSIDRRPGALNPGGWSSDGKPLIGAVPHGDIQVSKEMMDEERALINDAFLVTLFQIMTESPQMTATEVIERTNEKGILLAPSVGRLQSEYLGPLIDRELDLASELGLLPPMPPALREAKGNYHVVYTSPLSRAQRAQEVAGVQRTIENVLSIVNATQDPAPLDYFNWDVIVPETSAIQGVPPSWMRAKGDVDQLRQARAQNAQQQQEIQALPAQAAMVKAAATMHKAGMKPATGG